MFTFANRSQRWRFPIRAMTVAVVLVALGATGCSSKPTLMPTPAIYADTGLDPLPNVPPELQSNRVPVLFVTDRVPETPEGKPADPNLVYYGQKRSRSAAFGVAEVQIGENVSWDELAKLSRTAKRDEKLVLSLASARELARFDLTPTQKEIRDSDVIKWDPTAPPPQGEAEKLFIQELTDRLAKTPRKDVFVYVHGYNNTFEDGVLTAGEVWHFVGRQGVPLVYSWPAGKGGLRAYNYTIDSALFTVYHLKQTLRLIASCPAVEKVHVIAHSRGTDVASSAIRELHIEIRGMADTQKTLKLGTLVLAAADMDVDAFIQRMATERVGRACERVVLYICNKDKALGFSNWLFRGMMRLGDITSRTLGPQEVDNLRNSRRIQIVDARVSDAGSFGHNYFHSSPAVSSDLIMLLRYQLDPGESGRPLGTTDKGFWTIDDHYPKSATSTAWREAIAAQAPTAQTAAGKSTPP
jgi:esterase/lipase superfamily enzyme